MLRKLPERLGYCYERASECRDRARKARTSADAQYYLDRECRWLLLARSCELSDRIRDFTEEVARRRLIQAFDSAIVGTMAGALHDVLEALAVKDRFGSLAEQAAEAMIRIARQGETHPERLRDLTLETLTETLAESGHDPTRH
jgi:hypothetical protein